MQSYRPGDNTEQWYHERITEVEHGFVPLDAQLQPLKDRTDINMLSASQAVTTFPSAPKGRAGFSVTYPALCFTWPVVRC